MKLSNLRLSFTSLMVIFLCGSIAAQSGRYSADDLRPYWEEFNEGGWHLIDYSKTLLTEEQIAVLVSQTSYDSEMGPSINALSLARGIVFGKHGRVFKDRSVQQYLESQDWYKADPEFENVRLSSNERANLDLVRLAEAAGHNYILPGDLRLWQNRLIPEEKLAASSVTAWRILIAEIEAIHGKTFDTEPWLQKYFEERYWYTANANYSPDVLNEFERKNLETINAKRNEDRNVAVSLGDMDKFQNVQMSREMLQGLTMNELRLIRNEFFARNGFRFSTPGISQFFDWRDWYNPVDDNSKVQLNETELQNVRLIELVERELRDALSKKNLEAEDLSGLFIEDLRILRNEIFAKHGKIFKDANLRGYFERQSWYKPNPEFRELSLSKIEKSNLEVIRGVEEYSVSRFDLFEG